MKKHTHAETEFSKITENIYVGTNLCCTSSPHAEVLANEGITSEIDLEEERQSSPPKIDVYTWIPVKDHTAPSQDQLAAGVAMIKQAVDSGRKIYVHCKLGHGRSPTLVAAYFISLGDSVEDAIAKIKSERHEIHLDNIQIEALEVYFSKIKS